MSIFGSKDPFGRSYAGSLPILGAVPDSYIWPIIGIAIAIVFIVLVIIYAVLQHRKTTVKKLLKGPVDLFRPTSPVVIDRDSVAKFMRGTYTLAFYIQIDAIPDMRASATKLFIWPGIWNMDYKPASEEMIWTFTQTRNTPTEDPIPETVVMPRVPLQRWVQVVIGFEGRSVDLYANGELVKSELLNNLPTSGSSSITIVPNNVMGKLAYVQLWPRRLPVHEVAANYRETSDSQGRPFIDPGFFAMFKVPNIFCPNGDCIWSQPTTSQSQTWEFPYA